MRVLGFLAALALTFAVGAGGALAQTTCPNVSQLDVLGQLSDGEVLIRAAEPLQEAQSDQLYIQENSNNTGACVNHFQVWKWQGTGCGSSGSGQALSFAAANLRVWGCPSGTITKLGGDGAVYNYPTGNRIQ